MNKTSTLERTMAPDVDAAWVRDFLLEMRARDVPGEAIADALAEVNDYVHSSGASAEEGFGPARDYADSWVKAGLFEVPQNTLGAVIPTIIGVVAIQFILLAVRPLRDGTSADLTVGIVLGTGLTVVAFLLVGLASHKVFSSLIHRPWLAWTGIVLLVAAVGLTGLLKQVLVAIPAWPIAGIGVIFLALTVVLYLSLRRTAFTDTALVPPSQRSTQQRTVVSRIPLILACGYPLAALALALVNWFLM